MGILITISLLIVMELFTTIQVNSPTGIAILISSIIISTLLSKSKTIIQKSKVLGEMRWTIIISILTSIISTIVLYLGLVQPIGVLVLIIALGWMTILKLSKVPNLYQGILRPIYSYSIVILVMILIIRGLEYNNYIQAIPWALALTQIFAKIEMSIVGHIIALAWIMTAVDRKYGSDISVENDITSSNRSKDKIYTQFEEKFKSLAKFNLQYGIIFNWEKSKYIRSVFCILRSPFIWIARLPYSFSKWIYKEGVWYSFGLILIVFLFILIRVGSPIIYQTNVPDEFYHMAVAKSLVENGNFAQIYDHGPYMRGALISLLTALSFMVFGINFYSAKLVPIVLAFLSFFIIKQIFNLLKTNKNIQLLFFILYTFNPLIIFNHYTLRMYILYEIFFIIIVFLFIDLNINLRNQNYLKSIFSIIAICMINFLNFFYMYDTGKYTTVLATIVGCLCIFIYRDEWIKLFEKKLSFFKTLNILSIRYVIVSIALILIGIFGYDDILGIMGKKHFTPTEWDFYNLFFEYFRILTIFAVLGIIVSFLMNKKNEIMIGLIMIILITIHLISSLEIHHWRSIAYLTPIFLIFTAIGISYILQLKFNKIFKTIFFILTFVMIGISYSSIVPNDYFKIGPTIPEVYSTYLQANTLAASNFIANKFNEEYIFVESIRGSDLPSPKIFNIPIDYKLDLRQSERGLDNAMYVDVDGKGRPIYMNTKVITEINYLENLIDNNNVVFIVSEEAVKGNHLFNAEHFEKIKYKLQNTISFTGIHIYWN